MRNVFVFKNLLPRNTEEKDKERAALAAKKFSRTQLENMITKNNTLISSSLPLKEKLILEEKTEIYHLALTAKERWMLLCPYAKNVWFTPHTVGDHMQEARLILHAVYLKKFIIDNSQEDLIPIRKINPLVNSLRKIYEDLEEIQEASERELQHHFHNFLKNFFPSEKDVRSFYNLDGLETDLILRDSVGGTTSFVEIKKNDPDLEEAAFQASMYSLKWCSMKKIPGDYTVNFAAISLQKIKSRLGIIKVKILGDGRLKIISTKIYDPVKWGNEGKEAHEFVNHIRRCNKIIDDIPRDH